MRLDKGLGGIISLYGASWLGTASYVPRTVGELTGANEHPDDSAVDGAASPHWNSYVGVVVL